MSPTGAGRVIGARGRWWTRLAETGQSLRGAVAAVTGAARGIGLATARALAGAGAHVVLGDLDADLAAGAAAQFGGAGLQLDVRSEVSFAEFLDAAHSQTGHLDVLVNNAGVFVPGDFVTASAEEHQVQVEVNLGGVIRGMRLALPSMIARGSGRIVNIASAAGRMPSPGSATYSATKHAVVALTQAVRFELLGAAVHVTAVLPTAVSTEMSAGLDMRGVPQIGPEAVAAAVLRTLRKRRPPATVMVPRWLTAAAVIDAASPRWLRDLGRRYVDVAVAQGTIARSGYAERLAQQITAADIRA